MIRAGAVRRSIDLWLTAGMGLAALLVYLPALGGGFIWDDSAHVTRPELRSLHGLARIWTELGATQQYYPILHSAFWVEYRIWGDAAAAYHGLNVVLHVAAACLLAAVLRRLWTPGPGGGRALPTSAVRPAAWMAGFLFLLHPVCVESVAWVAEQKNTLSTVFYLLAALIYLRFAETRARAGAGFEEAAPVRSLRAGGRTALFAGLLLRPGMLYGLATLSFVLALLTKTVTASLPAGLLLAIWWKRRRLGRSDVAPLVPWFAMGIAAGLGTAWIEKHDLGAEGAAFALTAADRCILAGRVLWFYFGKLVWPAQLDFIYPRWAVSVKPALVVFPLAAAALLAALWAARGRRPGTFAAVAFFAGTLFPALGFFNVFPFLFSYVADHFQYLASLGIFALAGAAWGMGLAQAHSRLAVRTLRIGAVAALGAFAALAHLQCGIYRNAEHLYRTTLARNPGSWLMAYNLGVVLQGTGQLAQAESAYRSALRLKPDLADAHNNLAVLLAKTGRVPEAMAQFREAIASDEKERGSGAGRAAAAWYRADEARVCLDLGAALAQSDHFDQAAACDRRALAFEPAFAAARSALADTEVAIGIRLVRESQPDEALAHFAEALRLRPKDAAANYMLGLGFRTLDRYPQAIACFERALRARPNYPEAENDLGIALAQSGRPEEAVRHFEAALRLRPGFAEAENNLGFVLRSLQRR